MACKSAKFNKYQISEWYVKTSPMSDRSHMMMTPASVGTSQSTRDTVGMNVRQDLLYNNGGHIPDHNMECMSGGELFARYRSL